MIAQPQKMFFQDTVSVHRPSFYAERFQRFMCNTVFRKTSRSQNDLLSVILPLTCLSFNSLSVEKHDAMLYLLMFWCCLCLQWNHHHRRRAVQVVRACPGDCPWALHYQVPNPAAMRFLILDLSIIPTLTTLTMRLKLVRRREIVTKKIQYLFKPRLYWDQIFMYPFHYFPGMHSGRPDLLPSMPPLAGTSSDFEASEMPSPSVPPIRY